MNRREAITVSSVCSIPELQALLKRTDAGKVSCPSLTEANGEGGAAPLSTSARPARQPETFGEGHEEAEVALQQFPRPVETRSSAEVVGNQTWDRLHATMKPCPFFPRHQHCIRPASHWTWYDLSSHQVTVIHVAHWEPSDRNARDWYISACQPCMLPLNHSLSPVIEHELHAWSAMHGQQSIVQKHRHPCLSLACFFILFIRRS